MGGKTRPPYPPAYRAEAVRAMRVGRQPEELGRELGVSGQTLRNWLKQADLAREGLPWLIDSLSRLDPTPIIVEGPWLFADDLEPLLSTTDQAVWLVPSQSFKLESARRRDKPQVRYSTSDPEKAVRLWLARDTLLAKHSRTAALEHNCPCYEVDGSRSAEEIADLVGVHFARHLARVSANR